MKRKRRTEVATAEPIDPDQWIHDARTANDDEAVAWLTRMRATNTAPDEPTQKRRRLSVAAQRWEQYTTTADKLAQEHAQRSHDIYHSAHAAEVARHHLCTLHAYYTNTLTAKTDYHMLVTKLIKDHMATTTARHTHTHTCARYAGNGMSKQSMTQGRGMRMQKRRCSSAGDTRRCALTPTSYWTITYDKHTTCGASRNTWRT